MEKARNIANILKAFRTVRKDLSHHKTHKIRSKDVLSNKELNDLENHLFYFVDNSNSICENCKRFIS